jgi:hypothetical protein
MSSWHPIDTAPRDGREILVWCNGPRVTGCYIAVQVDEEEGWMERDGAFCFAPDLGLPSHWMPLPSEPSKRHEEAEHRSNWMAIASAPESQLIIGWSPSWQIPRMVETRNGQWWTEDKRLIDSPTRWMPIPAVQG